MKLRSARCTYCGVKLADRRAKACAYHVDLVRIEREMRGDRG